MATPHFLMLKFNQWTSAHQALFIGVLIAFLLMVYGAYWAYKSKFDHCVFFQVTHSAQDAFICGNHYFGVYGPDGYSVEKAEQYFGKAVEIDPTTPDVWHQYARTAFLHGNYKQALFRINKQFEMRGDELIASYYIRGLIYGYAKQYDKAAADFLRFLEWSPTNWAARNDLAWVYFADGKFKEAEEQTALGLINNPENPWLLVSHAMSAYNLGDKKTAEADLIKAQIMAERLTEANWSRAYPGNDPRIAGEGLASFKKAIETNLALVRGE